MNRAGRSREILRALMDPSASQAPAWESEELRALLLHQLATPLGAELDTLPAGFPTPGPDDAAALADVRSGTFRDVLADTAPCAAALRFVKALAKFAMQDDGGLPTDVARVLYVATIARARRAGHADISSLGADSLEREIRRCLTFAWLPEEVRDLLRTGAEPPTLPGA